MQGVETIKQVVVFFKIALDVAWESQSRVAELLFLRFGDITKHHHVLVIYPYLIIATDQQFNVPSTIHCLVLEILLELQWRQKWNKEKMKRGNTSGPMSV